MAKTTYTLEMQDADQFVQKESRADDFVVMRVTEPYAELSKFFHTLVGHPWRWGGHEGWGEAEWQGYVAQAGFEMWIGYRAGTPVGYFELCQSEACDVRVLNMGLISRFIGQKMGGALLTACVRRAWEKGATKVWLRTCSHDHPHAKATYESVGFLVVKVEEGGENPEIPSFWTLMTK